MTPTTKLTPSDEDRKPRTRAELLRARASALAIVARIDGELADLEEDGNASEYSSECLPPHTTRRAFAEWCRSGRVDAAMKTGAIWSCSRAAWRTAHERRSTPREPLALVPPASTADDEAVARAALASADLRVTRRAG